SVISTDVNSDGHPDIITANWDSNTVSVLLNNGNGTFQSKQDYATGDHPNSVTSSDVNDDSYQDLLTANWDSHTISVFLNNGNGTFQSKQDYAAGLGPGSITSVDVNSDDKQDVIIVNYHNSNAGYSGVSVLINDGNGAFKFQQGYGTDGYSLSTTSADINGDGKYDLITTTDRGNDGSVSILLNTTSPPTPTILGLATADDSGASNSDHVTSQTSALTINGSDGMLGSTLVLFDDKNSNDTIDNGEALATTTITVDNWSADIALTADTHAIKAIQSNRIGNSIGSSAASVALIITVDTSAPTTNAPDGLDLNSLDDTGRDANDHITRQSAGLTLAGYGMVGEKIWLYLFDDGNRNGLLDGGELLASLPMTQELWSVDVDLGQGSHAIRAVHGDVAGNNSPASALLEITVDSSVAAPANLALASEDDSGRFNNDRVTSQTTDMTIRGSGETGSHLLLFDDVNGNGVVDDQETLATLTVVNNSWSRDVALGAGSHALRAMQTDAAGNVSAASTALMVTVVTTAPEPPSRPDLAATDDSGASNSDNITRNSSNLTFSGSGLADHLLTLFDDRNGDGVVDGGELLTTLTVASSGNWSVDLTLTAGSHAIRAMQSGVVLDSAASEPLPITIDTSAPLLLSSTPADNAVDLPDDANIVLTFNEQLIAGLGNAVLTGEGDKRNISISDSSQVSISGTTVTINPAADLAIDGAYSLQMASGVLRDLAGNSYAGIADSSTLNFTVRPASRITVAGFTTSADEDQTLSLTDSDFSSRFSNPDNPANGLTKIRITALPAHGSLKIGGAVVALNQEIAVASLANLVYVPEANWNGSDRLSWNGSDGSFYASNAAVVTLTIRAINDRPIVTSFSKSGGSDRILTFAGSEFSSRFNDVDGDALNRIRITSLPDQGSLKLNGSPVTLGQEIGAAGLAGLAFTPAPGWTGRTSWQWLAFDGTAWSESAATITLDILPVPAEPTDLALLPSDDSGVSNSDAMTNQTSLTVTGRGVAGVTVTLLEDNTTIGTTTVDNNGVWAVAVSGLSHGTHTITATQTRDGNYNSARSTPLTVVVDTSKPTVAVAAPLDQWIGKKLTAMTGTAADQGSGVASVTLRVVDQSDGSYLTTSNSVLDWDSTPQWLTASQVVANSWDSWRLSGVNNLWTPGHSYQLTARVQDRAGHETLVTSTFGYGDKVATQISLDKNLQAIDPNPETDVILSGRLTLANGNDWEAANQRVRLLLSQPGGGSASEFFATISDTAGKFTIKLPRNLFSTSGDYGLSVRYDSDNPLMVRSSRADGDILVGAPVGYAIVVQGEAFLNGTAEGLLAHKRATNQVYAALQQRGFTAENIRYLNFDTDTMGLPPAADKVADYRNLPGVAANTPTREKLQNAIETWAYDRMTTHPAPLYLVLVDHGQQEIFSIGDSSSSGKVTSTDLATWLGNLDNRLKSAGDAGARALAQPQVAMLGFCNSGSFIDNLSRPGRIVISSATDKELSYRNSGNKVNGIEHGELFFDHLFQGLAKGDSLYEAFTLATNATESNLVVASNPGNAAANTVGDRISQKIKDRSGQHPLLDDNGDKIGSNELATQEGTDGALAFRLHLGETLTRTTNSLAQPVRIGSVAPMTLLGQGGTVLWLQESDPSTKHGGEAWVTVLPPDFDAPGSAGNNLQISFDLPTATMNYNEAAQRWEVNSSQIAGVDWNVPGHYQLQYSIRDSESDQLATPVLGHLYRSSSGNNRTPSSVTLQEPASQATVNSVGLFNWSDAVDADQDPVSYTLVVAQDNNLSRVVYRQEGLPLSWAVINFKSTTVTAGDYYWRVEAVDRYGAASSSAVGRFTLNSLNDIPAVLMGYLYNNSDYATIADATVTLNNQPVAVDRDGSLIGLIPTSGATLKIEKAGYKTQLRTLGATEAGSINQLTIGLERETVTLRYRLNGGAETSGISVVGSNKSDTITLLSGGSTLSLSSIEKVLGSTAADQIVLLAGASVSCSGVESVTGSSGTDTITLMTGGLLAISGVESVIGSAKVDTITL
ncbi:MAG: VCBS repeat-containing protein, partial [Magnetococcales bacterium]|nr:VCBS repeat-containing protein [Magnetococcales bacterium]